MTQHGVSMGQTESKEEREAALKQGKAGRGPPTWMTEMTNMAAIRNRFFAKNVKSEFWTS